jgi:PEGA domain
MRKSIRPVPPNESPDESENQIMKIHLLVFLPLLCLNSCATITRGVHDKLTVTSDPPGASVVLSTGEKGVTPAKFVKSRKTDSFTVTISKPGYVSQMVKVQSNFSPTGGTAMVGGAVAGGIISVGVDAVSGAYNSLYPNPVAVHLVPTATSKSRTSKRSTTAVSEEKPRAKSKTTKTPTKVETAPKIETAPRSETAPMPAPTATPYVPPTLETSPSP